MATIMLRTAAADDAPAIARLHVASFRATYARRFSRAALAALDPAGRATTWASRIAQHHGEVLVAEGGACLCGFAWVTPTPDSDDDARTVAQLRSIHVDAEVHGTGVGRRLIVAARETMRHWGAHEATLWVVDDNEVAARMYARDGWRPDGVTRQETLALPDEHGPRVTVVRWRRSLTEGRDGRERT